MPPCSRPWRPRGHQDSPRRLRGAACSCPKSPFLAPPGPRLRPRKRAKRTGPRRLAPGAMGRPEPARGRGGGGLRPGRPQPMQRNFTRRLSPRAHHHSPGKPKRGPMRFTALNRCQRATNHSNNCLEARTAPRYAAAGAGAGRAAARARYKCPALQMPRVAAQFMMPAHNSSNSTTCFAQRYLREMEYRFLGLLGAENRFLGLLVMKNH